MKLNVDGAMLHVEVDGSPRISEPHPRQALEPSLEDRTTSTRSGEDAYVAGVFRVGLFDLALRWSRHE